MPTAETAATASMTLPGPTGNPAARNVRAKCIRLASSRPRVSDAPGAINFAALICLPGEGRDASPPWAPAFAGVTEMALGDVAKPPDTPLCFRSCGFRLDLLQQSGGFAAVQAGAVVLGFEQHPQRVVGPMGRPFQPVALHQSVGP